MWGLWFYGRYNYSDELIQSLRYGELTNETVEAVIGGNPDLYFREYFVPKEIAWQAIEYFLKTGERDLNLIWEAAKIVETVWNIFEQEKVKAYCAQVCLLS